MNIIILGAGQVGSTVAHSLASEKNEITVVDINPVPLQELQAELDLRTVLGHASSPLILTEAGAADADMILAVTSSDETNMTACQIAQTLFNTPSKIARVRSADYLAYPQLFSRDAIPVDVLISPERVVTDYLARLIEYPSALQVFEFAQGKACLVGIIATAGGPLVGQRLLQLQARMPQVNARVAALFRADRAILPTGQTVIEAGDEVQFIASKKDIRRIASEFREPAARNRSVMIAGGGNIGFGLARAIEKRFNVRVIEKDPGRAVHLAESLNHAIVLNGDATDRSLLREEGIDGMDIFCALTNDDQVNILSAMLARRLGARRTVALVNRPSYVELVESDAIDVVVSPEQVTISAILPHVRRGDVIEAHALRHGAAEVLVAIAHGDRSTSQLVGRRVDEVQLPEGAMIVATIRAGELVIAHHDTPIESDDHLVLFLSDRRRIRDAERLFQVSPQFV